MAKANLLFESKAIYPDGAIIEMRIWRLPEAEVDRDHGLKYSLYYGRDSQRIIGYDNERGKGDHRHIRGVEEPYEFISPEKLISDFLNDIEKERNRDTQSPLAP